MPLFPYMNSCKLTASDLRRNDSLNTSICFGPFLHFTRHINIKSTLFICDYYKHFFSLKYFVRVPPYFPVASRSAVFIFPFVYDFRCVFSTTFTLTITLQFIYFLQATFFLSTYYQTMTNSCTNHE